MARAYICIARNDLPASGLQLLDLQPNTSQRNQVYDPAGQTCYMGSLVQNDVVATTGNGPKTATADYYGLAAYILDNICVGGGGGAAIPVADCNTIAAALVARAAIGGTMTLAAINGVIQLTVGASGIGINESTGSVEDMLKILSGAVWKLPSGSAVEDVNNVFVTAKSGFFVTAPTLAPSTVRGRRPSTPITTALPTQTGTHDAKYRNLPVLVDTPDLHRSSLSGAISKIKVATWAFNNPSFTYGAAGTAKLIDGTHILAGHAARALTVYAADGSII